MTLICHIQVLLRLCCAALVLNRQKNLRVDLLHLVVKTFASALNRVERNIRREKFVDYRYSIKACNIKGILRRQYFSDCAVYERRSS